MDLLNAATKSRSEKIFRRATCLSGDASGAAVKVTGPGSGSLLCVASCPVTDTADPFPVGIIIRKYSPTSALVQLAGPVSGVYSGLTPGAEYFVGSDALPTKTPAVSSHHLGVALDVSLLLLEPVVLVSASNSSFKRDVVAAGAAQTAFALSTIPSAPDTLQMSVNGQLATKDADYTVSFAVVTWLNTDFEMSSGDEVVFYYEVS